MVDRTLRTEAPLRGVLFDLDGTLVDSFQGIAATIDAVLTGHGQPPCDREVLRGLIGAPLERIFGILARLAPAESPAPAPDVQRYVDAYLAAYSSLGVPNTPLFPGMRELLDDCLAAGLGLAVVTTKRTAIARQVLRACGIVGHFAAVIGADAAPHLKPHPAPALAALDALRLGPGEAAVVGDATYDVAMAGAAGCRAIGVGWGYGGRSSLLEAGAEVVDGPAELRALLLGD